MANSKPRIGSAAKPISNSGRRPQHCACRPTHGENTATTSCGTTMQAAIRTVAHWLDRIVNTLPISGSMAALARWNSITQPARISSGALAQEVEQLRARLVLRHRRRASPWAPSASTSCGAIWTQGQKCRYEQHGGHEENCAGGKKIAASPHRRGCEPVADRGEARVAAEPLADRRMSDQPKADRHDAGPKHATAQRVQHGGRQARRERSATPHRPAHCAADAANAQCRPPAAPIGRHRPARRPASAPAARRGPPTDSTRPISTCVHFCEVR